MFVVVLTGTTTGVACAQRTEAPNALCSAVLSVKRPAVLGGYPTVGAVFVRGDYQTAFHAYYQTFFCDNRELYQGLDPHTVDSGVNILIQDGLAAGASGRYKDAASFFRATLARDKRADIARFLLGNALWAEGDRDGAARAWKSALVGPFYAQPPDYTGTPEEVVAARAMLHALLHQ